MTRSLHKLIILAVFIINQRDAVYVENEVIFIPGLDVFCTLEALDRVLCITSSTTSLDTIQPYQLNRPNMNKIGYSEITSIYRTTWLQCLSKLRTKIVTISARIPRMYL